MADASLLASNERILILSIGTIVFGYVSIFESVLSAKTILPHNTGKLSSISIAARTPQRYTMACAIPITCLPYDQFDLERSKKEELYSEA
jgi:hypothetical protein